MERMSDSDTTSAWKGSRSSPERVEEQRDHDLSVLTSILKEEFACVKHGLSRDLVY